MGACTSASVPSLMGGAYSSCATNHDTASNDIDQELNKEREARRRRMTFLMLGSGDSGKSTFTRQMSLIYSPNPISTADYIKYSEVLKQNALSSMQELLHVMKTKGIKMKSKYKPCSKIVNEANFLTPEVADAITELWRHSALKQAYNERYSSALSSAEFYFKHVRRFAAPDFLCTDEDVPYVKIRTTGIYETSFTINGMDLIFIDVGGQRSERRKWIHCFSRVTAVIYCCAIDEYNMVLEEDENVNRFEESLLLFRSVIDRFPARVPFVLFFNKLDLFERKLPTYPLCKYFPNAIEAKTATDLEPAINFLYLKFRDSISDGRHIYHHCTTATDRSCCKGVFDAVRNKVMANVLKGVGL